MYNVIIFLANGKIEFSQQHRAPSLEQMQTAVGGYIERIPHFTRFEYEGKYYTRGQAFANEDGIMKKLDFNEMATDAWQNCTVGIQNARLFGNVIFYSKEPRDRSRK